MHEKKKKNVLLFQGWMRYPSGISAQLTFEKSGRTPAETCTAENGSSKAGGTGRDEEGRSGTAGSSTL